MLNSYTKFVCNQIFFMNDIKSGFFMKKKGKDPPPLMMI